MSINKLIEILKTSNNIILFIESGVITDSAHKLRIF